MNRTVPYDPRLDELVKRAYRLVQETKERLRLCEEAGKHEAELREASLKAIHRHETAPTATHKDKGV
jgi:hypothetical protein